MPASPTYLDAEARLGGSFLHPGGRVATDVLLSFLDLTSGDRALELGCGPGSTLILAAQHAPAEIVALDASQSMLVTAAQRLERAGLATRVQLRRADLRDPLDFPAAYFDVVYAESVIALLDPEPVIREMIRVLKPSGRLALNERIWKSHVSQRQVDEINALSKAAFGIPAATPAAFDCAGWRAILERAGVRIADVIPVAQLPASADPPSVLATRLRRYRHYLARPRLVWDQLRFKRAIRRHRQAFDALESYLFLGEKAIEGAEEQPVSNS